jgi:NAD(P)-dependent dehydrogenase (short-subunit alcohol dehydrogenase family)
MRRDVRGRVVLVTGASRGIGMRVAERLGRLGARLAVTARSAPDLATLVGKLRAAGADAEAFPADLTNPADRERLVSGVADRFGGIDVLLNCAGVCSFGEFSTSTEDILRTVMEVNFFAPVEMIRLCHPHLAKSAAAWRPAVLNLASICGRWGIPSLPEHCASKHAFVGLTEALRAEYQRFGIDVLLVLPGLVRSDDLNRHLLRNEGKVYLNFEGAQPPDEVADGVVKSLLRNRPEATCGFVSWWVQYSRRMWPRGLRYFVNRKVRTFARRDPV